jgi:hypothetical protein
LDYDVKTKAANAMTEDMNRWETAQREGPLAESPFCLNSGFTASVAAL